MKRSYTGSVYLKKERVDAMGGVKNILKILVFSLVAIVFFLIIGSWVYHIFVTNKEIEATPPPGRWSK